MDRDGERPIELVASDDNIPLGPIIFMREPSCANLYIPFFYYFSHSFLCLVLIFLFLLEECSICYFFFSFFNVQNVEIFLTLLTSRKEMESFT